MFVTHISDGKFGTLFDVAEGEVTIQVSYGSTGLTFDSDGSADDRFSGSVFNMSFAAG